MPTSCAWVATRAGSPISPPPRSATIDIGRKYGPQFAGEHAPTLEEVIDLVRGRMKINIELKYNVPDPGLAPAVVELLRREDFIDQVVITSLDYAALKQVESIEPASRPATS